ncbi:MAG: hypothetical protein L3J82_08025, partial [Planctomycetes bacterium]|nr:hypothetical protein [Planctomycetota bacterium]
MMHHAEVTYLFRHVTLRDGAYQLHMPSERAALHELALIILGSILPENDRIALALDLAVHARQAQHGRTLLDDVFAQKELAYMKVAASYAKSKYQNAEAAGHYTSAANHPSCKPVEASRLLTQAAFLYWFAGERIRCESSFEQALKLAGMDR